MQFVRLLLFIVLIVLSIPVRAIGDLEIRAGTTSETVDWQVGTRTITVEFDLCVISSVWWLFEGWKPEPFWASLEPVMGTQGHALGDNGEIPVTFSFLKGNTEVPIEEGLPSSPVAGNNNCSSTSGYTLKAVMQVTGQGLYGNTYEGSFWLRLDWSHDNDSPTAIYTLAVNVPNVVQISDLENLTLTEQGDIWQAENDNICVYSSSPNGNFGKYAVMADSTDGFALEGPGRIVPYQLFWQDAAGNNWKPLGQNDPLTQQKGSLQVECTDGRRSGIRVEANKITITSGTYSDTVVLMVTPE